MIRFDNSQLAFEYFYDFILKNGSTLNNTKFIQNVGFYINNPLDNNIGTIWRKWSKKYAEKEWEWYLNGNLDPLPVVSIAKMWEKCKDENGLVRSNYGFQWRRGDQLNKVINLLKEDFNTRRASISLYDGKEIDTYKNDTICTYAINFNMYDGNLNMSVLMRSNDLVYGFCNDQYCFSKLQELVSKELNVKVGWYFHFSNNLHIYEKHFNLRDEYIKKSK